MEPKQTPKNKTGIQSGAPRMESRPSPEALRTWLDSRYPRTPKTKRTQRSGPGSSRVDGDSKRPFQERLEEWGTLLLILGVFLVWARLLLAAFGVFPLL